ncbi:MAG: 1,2-phenylacetyl-CoA epoxidase subunit PaaC [Woeseiaceae bacterium]
MTPEQALVRYLARLGDNALILGQRLIERVAGESELEEELANANLALDYIGQARMYYTRAGQLEGKGRDEDDFAFLRGEREFENVLLVERPNGHFGDTVLRQVLFDAFYVLQLEALERCGDAATAEIAARAVREIRYHLRHAAHWLIRLGDGTQESHRRVSQSLDTLWRYTGELFAGDEVDDVVRDHYGGPDLAQLAPLWRERVAGILAEARLDMPAEQWMAAGGKSGRHSEHFGYLLAEMQYLQRAFPGAGW